MALTASKPGQVWQTLKTTIVPRFSHLEAEQKQHTAHQAMYRTCAPRPIQLFISRRSMGICGVGEGPKAGESRVPWDHRWVGQACRRHT